MAIIKSKEREGFIKKGLEYITDKDSSYAHFFRNNNGEKLPEQDYRKRVSILEDSLNKAYDNKTKEKLKPKPIQYLATGLRGAALGGYGIGSALFLTGSGPVGFGFTGLSAGASYLADMIDSHYYHKSGLIKGFSKEDAKVTAEAITTKGLGYLPIGTGLIDIYRGRRKFREAALRNIFKNEDVMNYVISDFANKLHKEKGIQKIIPKSALKDQRYKESSIATAV